MKNIFVSALFIASINFLAAQKNTGSASLNPDKKGIVLKPESAGWYAGDIHVHRNCGDGTLVLSENEFLHRMDTNNLAIISVLADMGNGEVKPSTEDLSKVNGMNAPQSRSGRIIHWDAEWHWDATYTEFCNQALGGHLVLLNLKEAHKIWDESPYKILEWAKKQNAVTGFCHMQYLNDSIQNNLNCCIPIDYPVETALGTIDFISEDVYATASHNNGNYNSEAAMNAYYKLLNCGFRLGLAAGTDFPCNEGEPFGSLLTYVLVKQAPLTYANWIEGIKKGRTVVSRNGHNEFIDMKINGKYEPGDEIKLKKNGKTTIIAKWSTNKEMTGSIELVVNGKVADVRSGIARPGQPLILKTEKTFSRSSWICIRRMDGHQHQLHTSPIYVTVNNKAIRASKPDALFFIQWINNILSNIAPGGIWERYFTTDKKTVEERYRKARDIYKNILSETDND